MLKSPAGVAGLTLTLLLGTAHAQQQTPAGSQRPAQPPPPTQKSGNPTPGTPQPDPPAVADRVTVSGCVTLAPGVGAAPAAATTTPASNRFILSEAKKDGPVPPETGTSSAAAAASSPTYRLEALESQLSPFVNARVELSGEVKGSDTPPVLLVEFVRKIAAKCR